DIADAQAHRVTVSGEVLDRHRAVGKGGLGPTLIIANVGGFLYSRAIGDIDLGAPSYRAAQLNLTAHAVDFVFHRLAAVPLDGLTVFVGLDVVARPQFATAAHAKVFRRVGSQAPVDVLCDIRVRDVGDHDVVAGQDRRHEVIGLVQVVGDGAVF